MIALALVGLTVTAIVVVGVTTNEAVNRDNR
jgi:hypothetical protein